jgi:hypothetical protein
MIKFSESVYNKYNLNITKYKTLPSLALAAYRSSYIPLDLALDLALDLKMVKGVVEKDIRRSYFGGNVDVFINEVTNGYLYDVNSNFYKAMLNDMPVGEPILSLETDLDKIYSKAELRESRLNKNITIPSAVHIAAAITSYARIIIN